MQLRTNHAQVGSLCGSLLPADHKATQFWCRPCVQAVEMFLDEKIGYLDIVKVVEDTCETHKADLMQQPSLQVRRPHGQDE